MGYLFAIGAAGLWATLGLFYWDLTGRFGLPPVTVAFFRAGLSFALLLPLWARQRRNWTRLGPRDLPLFLAFGFFGIAAFYVVYVYAVVHAGMAIAVVLLYTAPAWVVLISWRFLGERIGKATLVALALAMSGCALVAQVYDPARVRLNAFGVAFGLGAGISYALYTVFTKAALRRHQPWAVVFYSLGFGTLVLLPFQSLEGVWQALRGGAFPFLLFLSLGPTLGAAFLYALALRRLPASIAGTVATLEPVMGIALAMGVRGEPVAIPQLLGAGLIIAGVIVLSLRGEA